MASAWAWVSRLFLTSSASVSPIAFWIAALTCFSLVPRSADRCEMKSLQTADAPVAELRLAAVSAAWAWVEEAGRKPTVKPAAEAVTSTAAPATATAPRAKPAIRTYRSLESDVITGLLDDGAGAGFI